MTRNLWHHLVRSLFVPKSARVSSSLRSGKHTLKNRFRPTFERLDDRVVPAVITVNTLADTDDGASLGATISLRDAINDCTPGDTVQFDSSLDGGAIKLSSNLGSLNINHDLTIDGLTGLSKGITVDGGNAVRDFFVRPDFVHSTSATASISGLTIKNGHGNGGGGVYVNDAGLTISNCTIIANSADSSGGGIFADEINARVTAIDCTITKNTAVAGGGVSINDSFYGCNFTAINCTISGNSSTRDGGGIDVSGPAFLKNTLVAGNSAPSGPDIDGDPIANYCLIQNTTNCIL